MKVTSLGSCRQHSLQQHFTVTQIQERLTYPHYTKEILQAIEFCKGISAIPGPLTQSLFRSGILEQRSLDPRQFKEEFESTDVFVVEIASRLAYRYKGFYAHHIPSMDVKTLRPLRSIPRATKRLRPIFSESETSCLPNPFLLSATSIHGPRAVGTPLFVFWNGYVATTPSPFWIP